MKSIRGGVRFVLAAPHNADLVERPRKCYRAPGDNRIGRVGDIVVRIHVAGVLGLGLLTGCVSVSGLLSNDVAGYGVRVMVHTALAALATGAY